jgi:hypothetical protein
MKRTVVVPIRASLWFGVLSVLLLAAVTLLAPRKTSAQDAPRVVPVSQQVFVGTQPAQGIIAILIGLYDVPSTPAGARIHYRFAVSGLLPYIEQDTLYLSPGRQQPVDLRCRFRPPAPGTYTVTWQGWYEVGGVKAPLWSRQATVVIAP